MRILVIFTGGTIGSSAKDGYISPDGNTRYQLLTMYRETTKDLQEFDVDMPYTVLSENLDGSHMTELVQSLNHHIKSEKYAGIIVTHGTDTLQYTAAAAGILFSEISIPVILVSSNYPLEDERANGLTNFVAAVEYIKNNGHPGVYVSYQNRGQEVKIFLACSLLRYDIYSDEIRNLAEMTVENSINPQLHHTKTFLYEQGGENEKIILTHNNIDLSHFDFGKTSPIKYILPYPGMQYEMPGEGTKAILFGSYHSGTIQTASHELQSFCKNIKERNIPMYICGVPEGIGYESTKYYEMLGINVLPYGTDIYWYMRLWIEAVYKS